MNIPLKTLLIFGLLIALSTQEEASDSSASSTPPNPASDSTTTPTSTSAATPTTTSAAPTSTGTFTTGTTSNSTDKAPASTTAAATTTTTQAPTSTGTFTTGTTSDSTDKAPASPTAAATTTTTQAPTSTGTFTTGTTYDSTDNAPASPTAAATTTTTQAPTSTGTFTTGTTSDSTDNAPASPTAAATTTTTQAPTRTGTFTTGTTSDSISAITTAATITNPCATSPCFKGSTCEERFGNSFACICQSGMVYLESGCTLAKVFPCRLTFDMPFHSDMADKASEKFQMQAGRIEIALKNILAKDKSYINSTVLSLSSGSINAVVQNIYYLSSTVTSANVEQLIQEGMINEIGDFLEFKRVSLCEQDICDSFTTNCTEDDVPGTVTCTCKKEYISSQFSSYFCVSCPNGKKAVNDKCEKCPFGYSGFNCNDSYLLVVVIMSTLLGALLVIFIVVLIFVSCRDQKDSSSAKVDFSSNYGNTELHKPTGVPRIPRANPDASWKSDNLEMANGGSNQALVIRDRPESKAHYSDYEDVSYRGQVPPAYSSYGGRGVENGVQNPYFRQDDDRTRRY